MTETFTDNLVARALARTVDTGAQSFALLGDRKSVV